MNIAGTVALVTGGTSGLGLAAARRLLKAGAHVVVVGRAAEKGAAVAQELGERAAYITADIASEKDVASALEFAKELGTLRIAVNCAGISKAARTVGRRGPALLDDFSQVIQTNLIGTFNVTRLAAAQMSLAEEVDGERGVIVNTASIAAFDGQTGQAAYAASKGGIVGMTLPLARDLAALKIRVMTVAPGFFDTPLLAGVSKEAASALGAQVPHPARIGDPVEYGALVEHIVENPMLNGETIRLDGALRLASH